MISFDEDENDWLKSFIEDNFEKTPNFFQVSGHRKQIDVFLINEPQFSINSISKTK